MRDETASPRFPVFFIALLIIVLCIVGRAGAGDRLNIPMRIKGTMLNSCEFSTPGIVIAFGRINPAAAEDTITKTADIPFTCSSGTKWKIAVDAGRHRGPGARMKHAERNEFIPYTMTVDPSSGKVNGYTDHITSRISGTVKRADVSPVPPGLYTDVVTITLTALE